MFSESSNKVGRQNEKTLVILVAGIGSRVGGGVKFIPLDLGGHLIIDYSIPYLMANGKI